MELYLLCREKSAEMLEEAFQRGGQSALQLDDREFFDGSSLEEDKPFLRVIVCPQSHRISSLLLHIYTDTYKDFLLLPPGLFGELV